MNVRKAPALDEGCGDWKSCFASLNPSTKISGGNMKRLVPHFVGAFAWVGLVLLAFPSEVMAQSIPSRVSALESQMKVVQTAVVALTAQNVFQAAQISALQTVNGTQTGQITALQAASGTQSAQIAALQGENGTQAAQIAALQEGTVPVGTIIAYSSETPPAGYLECNGTQLIRAAYPSLFTAIGTAFGAGDGSSTFHVPDLRGQFLRGWAHGSGVDPDVGARGTLYPGGAAGDHVGSSQLDRVGPHTHQVFAGAANPFGGFTELVGANASDPFYNPSTVSTGSTETRPKNVAVMFAIKY